MSSDYREKAAERLQDLDRTDAWSALIIALFLLSGFNMLLGFTSWGDIEVNQKTYSERINSLQPIQPGFYEERLSNFREYGARSEVLMALLGRYKGFDITYSTPYGPENLDLARLGGEGVLLSTDLLPVAVAVLLFTPLAWTGSRRLGKGSLLLAAIILVSSVSLSSIYIQGEVYRGEIDNAVNGSMDLAIYTESDETPYFKLVKTSPEESVKVEIKQEEDVFREINLTGTEDVILYSAETGWNDVELSAECAVPAEVEEGSTDDRCLSFGVKQIGYNGTKDFDQPALSGFYRNKISQTPWMQREAAIVYSSPDGDGIPVIKLEKVPFIEDYSPSFYVNGEYTEYVMTDSDEGRRFLLYNASLREGVNYVEIKSESCFVPAQQSATSRDERCLSYELHEFDLVEDPGEYLYSRGWHDSTSDERWMRGTGELLVDMENRNSAIKLELKGYSEIRNNTAEIYFNGRNVRNVSLDQGGNAFIPVKGDIGLNEMKIISRKGCKVPAEVENSSDTRCLSLRLENLSVSEVDKARFHDGWFMEEKTDFGSYRWMTNRSFLIYNSTGEDILDIDVEPYHGVENSTLKIFANGQKIAEVPGEELGKNDIYLETDPGITTLRLESSKGCAVPAEVEEDSIDHRCLSFRFDSLEIDSREYGDGWYSREGDSEFSYRWMSVRSSMIFASEGGDKKLQLEFKPYRHLENPELEVKVNGDYMGTLELSGRGRVRRVLEIDTREGINTIRLESRSGCEIPSEHERLSNDRRCLSFQFNRLEIRG